MRRTVITYMFMIVAVLNTSAAQDTDEVDVTPLTETLYRLTIDDFVNIVAFKGPEGVILVDSGFEETAGHVRSTLGTRGFGDIQYIINTHSDYDHVAGNRALRGGAVVLAHVKCRDQMVIYASPDFDIPFDKTIFRDGLPALTFEGRLTLHFGGEEVEIIPMPGGHTDEDVIVYFREARVAYIGDIVLPDSFPVVKLDNGGTVEGLMQVVEQLIDLFPDDTLLVVGHGREMKAAELRAYHEMLVQTTRIVKDGLEAGKDPEEMKQQNVLKGWEAWTNKKWPDELNPSTWIETICKSVSMGE